MDEAFISCLLIFTYYVVGKTNDGNFQISVKIDKNIRQSIK